MSATDDRPATAQDRTYRAVIVVLVAALAAAAALAVWSFLRDPGTERGSADSATLADLAAAEESARDLLVDMTTYDFRELDDEYAWLDRLTDADLRARMEERVADIGEVITAGKVTARGTVERSAYRANEDGSVTVIAFVRQRITDRSNDGRKLEEQWATLTMVRDAGDWLVDDIELSDVPQPGGRTG